MSAGFTLPLTTKQFQDHPAAHHDSPDDQRAEAPLVHPDIGPCAEAGNAFSDPCEQAILTEGLSQHVGFASLRDRHEARELLEPVENDVDLGTGGFTAFGLIGALLFVWGLVGHLENDR